MKPWEKYQQEQAGPWLKYQKTAPAPAPEPTITGPYVPYVSDTGMQAPTPRIGFSPGAGRAGTPPPEATEAASIGAFMPDKAPEYAHSTAQAMKEAVASLPLLSIGGGAFNAPTLAGRIARGAKAGGFGGFLYGTGTGEGNIGQRLERGGITAGLGTLVGGVAPPVIEGGAGLGGAVGRRATPFLQRIFGGAQAAQGTYRDQAARKVAQTIMEQFPDMAPEQAIRNAQRVVQRYGPKAALMDAGELTRELAKATVRQGGTPGMQIEKFATQRQEGALAPSGQVRGGQYERVSNILDEAAGGQQSGLSAQRSLKAQQTAASKPLYEQTANNPGNLVPLDESTQPVFSDPYVTDQIGKVQASKLHGLNDLAPNSMPVIDATQKRMSDAASKAYRQGKTYEGNLISEKRRALVEAADKAFPDYAKAREVWRDFKGVMNADDLGRKFMRGEIDILQDSVGRMSPEELAQFRAGVMAELKNRAGKMVDTSNIARNLLKTPDIRSRVRLAFDSPQVFRKYMKGLVDEREMARAYSAITRGSDSLKNAASMLRTSEGAGNIGQELVGTGADVLTGNKVGLLYRLGRALKPRGILGPPEPVRQGISGLLTGQDIEPLLKAAERIGLSQAQKRALEQLLLTGTMREGQQGLLR